MTKIVLLADLHGNMTATRAMEQELERIQPDEIYFLGDAVGKGPENDKTCDWVKKHCQYFVGGNWDFGIAEGNYTGQDFYQKQLGKERLDWLRALPKELSLTMSGVEFRLFHGRPVTPLFQGSDSDEELYPYFMSGAKTYGGFICADSHRPYQRLTAKGYAINTGSIGNSLCITRAHALLLEGEKENKNPAPLHMTTLSVPYDNHEAVQIAQETKELPNREAYMNEILTGVYSR